jgi:predicted TIM-barrel fold metal-dependent hydrolase
MKNITDAGIFKVYGTDYTVLLSMDGIYKNGKFIGADTCPVLPNSRVINISKISGNVMFGASVHPYRDAREMLAETRRCISEGAVLFNWMPSVQQIDPEDDRCIPFYLCLVREGIPLLCLSAPGAAAQGNHIKLNHPGKLIRALDISVKVIAAFSPLSDYGYDDPYYEEHFNELIGMLRASEDKKWDLYADISAFCVPPGFTYLERIRREIENGGISQHRFVFGSEVPERFAHNFAGERLFTGDNLSELLKARSGRLDNHYDMLKKSGIHDSIFFNAGEVLRLQNQRDFAPGQRYV